MSNIDDVLTGESDTIKSPDSPKLYHQHKIRKYKLEAMVLDGFINEGLTFTDLAKICNIELLHRQTNLGDEYHYQPISVTNVTNYLDIMRDQLTAMKQDMFEQSIKGTKVVDKVRHLNALVHSGYERREAIRTLMKEAFEIGAKKTFFDAIAADRQNDAQIGDILKSLSLMEGKLSTHVTVDYVRSLINRIVDQIIKIEDIDFAHKEKIVLSIHNCIDLENNYEGIDLKL